MFPPRTKNWHHPAVFLKHFQIWRPVAGTRLGSVKTPVDFFLESNRLVGPERTSKHIYILNKRPPSLQTTPWNQSSLTIASSWESPSIITGLSNSSGIKTLLRSQHWLCFQTHHFCDLKPSALSKKPFQYLEAVFPWFCISWFLGAKKAPSKQLYNISNFFKPAICEFIYIYI